MMCIALCGCAEHIASFIPGAGRADWELQITDQYYIIRANSRSKKISKSTDVNGVYVDVLSHFYVTRYCVNESYIFLEGIPTADVFASEEELMSDTRQYYLVDTGSGEVFGAYDSETELNEFHIETSEELLSWEVLPQ